jgi:hypothetical protein
LKSTPVRKKIEVQTLVYNLQFIIEFKNADFPRTSSKNPFHINHSETPCLQGGASKKIISLGEKSPKPPKKEPFIPLHSNGYSGMLS